MAQPWRWAFGCAAVGWPGPEMIASSLPGAFATWAFLLLVGPAALCLAMARSPRSARR